MNQQHNETSRSRTGIVCLVLTAAAGLFADLFTKHLAITHLAPPAAPLEFLPGYLNFTFVENHGAVFGVGQGYRWVFVIVSLAAVFFVGYLFTRAPRRWWYDLTLGMLLAGILGNLHDRIFVGYVRDMIHALPRWPNLFPWVFNVADSLLCVSIAILILSSFFLPEETRHESSPEPVRD